MDGVERLSLVAKVLMDTRLLELKRENEELKLKLFWKEHDPCMLKQAMAAANTRDGGPRCKCLACIVGGRCENGTQGFSPYPAQEYADHYVMSRDDICHLRCQFKPWFEDRIREAGMRVRDMPSSVWVGGSAVVDGGDHFVNMGRVDWNDCVYGSRLRTASSAGDRDLGKLNRLFHVLDVVAVLVDEFGLPITHPRTPIGSSSR
jgi:hypothetical protein